MSKEVSQILLDLKRKIFRPVYFLSGEETFYIDQVSDYIEENALDEAEREFNQAVVYGKDTDLAGILSLARQFPMMSERRVVIVKEAQNLKEFSKKAGSDDAGASESPAAMQQFVAYLAKPLASTILVFCYKYKTIDKRSAVAKALQKNAVFLEAKKLYDNQVPQWITSYITDRGYRIDSRAAYIMAEYVGNDLSRIAGETAKLLISLAPGEEITLAMIQENIGMSKEYNIFELQSALGKKDVLKANRIINYFAANEKENPIFMLLGTLYGYFSKVLRYQSLADKSKFAAASALGVNPYFVEDYATASANYSFVKLKHIFSLLKQCDLRSKGVDNASVPAGELMKELVYGILH